MKVAASTVWEILHDAGIDLAPAQFHDVGPARWFALAVLALNALGQVSFLPACPFWSLMIIAVDVVALHGLCAYGSRANLAALSVRKNVVEGRRS